MLNFFQVGNQMFRGISGGEKKRACIAMELITAPSVLFLDEPTTGLDASTANAVMVLLKRYLPKHCILICYPGVYVTSAPTVPLFTFTQKWCAVECP